MNTLAKLALPMAAVAVAAPMVSAQSAEVAMASGSEQVITAYTTGYTWFDNTPVGSAEIAHPVIHDRAAGTGTWSDPVTIATASGRFLAGTRFYIPNMRRYFIAEDIGGANMYNPPAGASAWLDMWIGGAGGSASGADRCASALTANHKVIVNPKQGYAVQAGTIYDGTCHGNYGDSVQGGTVSSPATRTATPVKKVTVKAKNVVAPKASAHRAPKPVDSAVKKVYTVKKGDTLSSIAKANGTTWQKLFQLNRTTMKSPNVLFIGQHVTLA